MIRPKKPAAGDAGDKTGGRTGRVPRPRARGTLLIIATLLAGSGLMRLGEGAGHAFARAAEPEEMAQGIGAAAQVCEPEPGALAMLEAIQKREARLAEREATLADRMQALALAEEQIEARLAALVAAEEDLAATISVADSAAEEDIARLTAVYENMKPKDAAALFEEMAPEFAAGFLGRMRPDAAGAVMAGLDPKTAYTISVLLAGRNADVPKN
jgi:flagellar motility protein MotE (MotC chaperone)